MMSPRFRAVVAEVACGIEDEVASALGRGSLGVELREASPGRTALRVYLPAVEGEAAHLGRAAEVLRAFGLEPEECALRAEEVEDGRWVERYQATLLPMPLGERFVVVPGETAPPPGTRTIVRVVPGMAFGTGEHPTTRQCAAALERRVAAGSRWLDLGTGTGILAMVARLSGAASVLAVDLDPAAVAVAREAVGANGLASGVEVREGSVDGLAGSAFDGVVANIAASFFLSRAREISSALRRGGILVAAGFLTDDLPEVEPALAAAGIRVVGRGAEGPWALLEAERE